MVRNGITGHTKKNPVFPIIYDTRTRAHVICSNADGQTKKKKKTEPAAAANPFLNYGKRARSIQIYTHNIYKTMKLMCVRCGA